MAIAEKLQNIINEKSQQATMTNYGLTSGNQITSSTKFIDYPKYIFNAFLEALRTPDTLFNNLPKKSGTGTNITLNDTANAPMRIELGASDISQDGTPTPDSPQDIHTISGSNKVVVCGKNFLNYNDFTTYGTTIITDETISIANNTGTNIAGISIYLTGKIPAGTYTFTNYADSNATIYLMTSSSDYSHLVTSNSYYIFNYDGTSFLRLLGTNISPNDTKTYKLQLEVGNSKTQYAPYVSQVKELNLGVENKFNLETATAGTNLTKSGDTFISNAISSYGGISINLGTPINIKNGDTYYISYDIKVNNGDLKNLNYFGRLNNGTNYTTFGNLVGTFNISNNYQRVVWLTSANADFTANNIVAQANASITNAQILEIKNIQVAKSNGSYTEYGKAIEYCKIGNYEDKFIRTSGKNLANVILLFGNSTYYSISNNQVSALSSDNRGWTSLDGTTWGINLSAGTYTLSFNSATAGQIQIYGKISGELLRITLSNGTATFTLAQDDIVGIKFVNISSYPYNAGFIMLNEGITALPYEPYGTDEWYLKKNIGKVVLDGSESWYVLNMPNVKGYQFSTANLNMKINTSDNNLTGAKLTILQEQTPTGNYISTENTKGFCINTSSSFRATLGETTADLQGFKDMLAEKLPLLIYQLATPTYTKIEGTLANQLEDIYQYCKSYKGTTNISQINNDLPFVFNVSALENI